MARINIVTRAETYKAAKAFCLITDAIPCWHAYHNRLAAAVYPFHRILDILSDKPESEHATRLKLFRPIRDDRVKEWVRTRCYDYNALASPPPFVIEAHKQECGCKEWNGEEIVFLDEPGEPRDAVEH